MSKLNFDYVPLTFISDKQEIKKQIRNTLILIHLFEKYNSPVRLENLIEGTQYGYNASALQSGKNKFLRISDIHESKVNWDSVPYCNCDDEETYLLKNEDILIARTGGTTGKSFKIDSPPKHSIYAGYLIRIRAKKEVNPDYIYLFLHSFAYWSQIVNLNERNFRPKANAENLKSLILPDCERRIQDEVVRISQGEKIKGYEDLYSKIEKALSEYNKTQQVENLLSAQLTQLENLNQAILQEAVQGKLVKQDPKDEPASELLKRIKAEKQKAGKKEKPLPPIKPSDIPFEIPENWVWCRLGEMFDIERGSSPRPKGDPRYFSKIKTPFHWITISDMTAYAQDKPLSDTREFLTELGTKHSRYVTTKDIIIVASGSAGRTSLLGIDGFIYDGLMSVKNIPDESMKHFLFYLFKIFEANMMKLATGATWQNINTDILKNQPVPIPPLSEQKRIVAEIEKQFAKTKQLKEHIIANQQATEQLLKALLHQAFEVEEMDEVNS
jgi:type I restriction enzyme, S subunit